VSLNGIPEFEYDQMVFFFFYQEKDVPMNQPTLTNCEIFAAM